MNMKRIRLCQWLGVTLLGVATGCGSTSGDRYAEAPKKTRGVALMYGDNATACQSCRTYKGPQTQPIQPAPAYVVPAGHTEEDAAGQVVNADHSMVEGEPPMVVPAAAEEIVLQVNEDGTVVQVQNRQPMAMPVNHRPQQVVPAHQYKPHAMPGVSQPHVVMHANHHQPAASQPTVAQVSAPAPAPTGNGGSQWAPIVEHVVPARGALRGESIPARRDVHDITASPCFAKADDYSWLQGQVEYSRMNKSWRLRYASVDETDKFGGSVTLTGDTLLDSLKDGEYVRIRGYLPNPDARGIAPTYRVETIDKVESK